MEELKDYWHKMMFMECGTGSNYVCEWLCGFAYPFLVVKSEKWG